jgi:hypothetical protein
MGVIMSGPDLTGIKGVEKPHKFGAFGLGFIGGWRDVIKVTLKNDVGDVKHVHVRFHQDGERKEHKNVKFESKSVDVLTTDLNEITRLMSKGYTMEDTGPSTAGSVALGTHGLAANIDASGVGASLGDRVGGRGVDDAAGAGAAVFGTEKKPKLSKKEQELQAKENARQDAISGLPQGIKKSSDLTTEEISGFNEVNNLLKGLVRKDNILSSPAGVKAKALLEKMGTHTFYEGGVGEAGAALPEILSLSEAKAIILEAILENKKLQAGIERLNAGEKISEAFSADIDDSDIPDSIKKDKNYKVLKGDINRLDPKNMSPAQIKLVAQKLTKLNGSMSEVLPFYKQACDLEELHLDAPTGSVPSFTEMAKLFESDSTDQSVHPPTYLKKLSISKQTLTSSDVSAMYTNIARPRSELSLHIPDGFKMDDGTEMGETEFKTMLLYYRGVKGLEMKAKITDKQAEYFKDVALKDKGKGEVRHLNGGFDNLERLSIAGSDVSPVGVRRFIKARRSTKLRHLDVSQTCKGARPEDVRNMFSQGIRQGDVFFDGNYVILNFAGIPMDDEAVSGLLKAVAKHPDILAGGSAGMPGTVFNLSGTGIRSPSSIKGLIKAVARTNWGPVSLDLSGNGISAEAYAAIREELESERVSDQMKDFFNKDGTLNRGKFIKHVFYAKYPPPTGEKASERLARKLAPPIAKGPQQEAFLGQLNAKGNDEMMGAAKAEAKLHYDKVMQEIKI